MSSTTNAILIRAFKTFVQGAVSALLVTNGNLTTAGLIGIFAAGVSAVMNLFIQPVEAK